MKESEASMIISRLGPFLLRILPAAESALFRLQSWVSEGHTKRIYCTWLQGTTTCLFVHIQRVYTLL